MRKLKSSCNEIHEMKLFGDKINAKTERIPCKVVLSAQTYPGEPFSSTAFAEFPVPVGNAHHLNRNFFRLKTLCTLIRRTYAPCLCHCAHFLFRHCHCIRPPTFSVPHSMTFIKKKRNFFSSALGFFFRFFIKSPA